MRSLRPTTVTALLLGAGLTALVTETIAIAEPSGDDTHEVSESFERVQADRARLPIVCQVHGDGDWMNGGSVWTVGI